MAAQGRAAVGHQADARPHHTSRSAHLRQSGAGENQIDQDERFDCHVNSAAAIAERWVARVITSPLVPYGVRSRSISVQYRIYR
ncbi:hypothetical protein MRB56_04470 [Halomonas cupida]|uniref:hypothetical protein n=1 Tax=Halomonas cupida TaxID=44933 RepID=UPI0039B67634